jgi:hypothetical protein
MNLGYTPHKRRAFIRAQKMQWVKDYLDRNTRHHVRW